MTDELTPAEKSAMKWIQFSERMEVLNAKYEEGDINSHDAWKSAQYNYHLIRGLENDLH